MTDQADRPDDRKRAAEGDAAARDDYLDLPLIICRFPTKRQEPPGKQSRVASSLECVTRLAKRLIKRRSDR